MTKDDQNALFDTIESATGKSPVSYSQVMKWYNLLPEEIKANVEHFGANDTPTRDSIYLWIKENKDIMIRELWYKVVSYPKIEITPIEIDESNDDWLRIENASYKKRSKRINYFQTKKESKQFLVDYFSKRIIKSKEEIKQCKIKINKVLKH